MKLLEHFVTISWVKFSILLCLFWLIVLSICRLYLRVTTLWVCVCFFECDFLFPCSLSKYKQGKFKRFKSIIAIPLVDIPRSKWYWTNCTDFSTLWSTITVWDLCLLISCNMEQTALCLLVILNELHSFCYCYCFFHFFS